MNARERFGNRPHSPRRLLDRDQVLQAAGIVELSLSRGDRIRTCDLMLPKDSGAVETRPELEKWGSRPVDAWRDRHDSTASGTLREPTTESASAMDNAPTSRQVDVLVSLLDAYRRDRVWPSEAELSEELGIYRSAVQGHLSRLLSRGLVARAAGPGRSRARSWTLTRRGEELAGLYAATAADAVEADAGAYLEAVLAETAVDFDVRGDRVELRLADLETLVTLTPSVRASVARRVLEIDL